jgi:hypothetical protein
MRKIIIIILILTGISNVNAQTEIEEINKTLFDYIEGTANGQPDRLKRAFHPDFNLYFISKDTLRIWSGKKYIENVRPGVKSNRIGKVISIDFEGNAASAKIEVNIPGLKRIYTDYLLLLKIHNSWKIIHKSFTFKNYPK